jgi:CRP-like cAMP-binding protein
MTDGLKQHLAGVLKLKELSKKSYLLKAGHISRNIYFIVQGLIRCFYLKDDHEINSWFMKQGDVIVSVESFFLKKKAMNQFRLWKIAYFTT